jgi:uncharacterized LabA/DUF88 family protein
MNETLVFIDEAFLSKLSKYFGTGRYIKFDRYNFSENLAAREGLKLKQVFLYIAPPFQGAIPSAEEEKKKEGYDKLVSKLKQKNIIVREGRCQRLKIDGEFEYGQKAVDILLAIDLMSVSKKYSLVKKIILISSDSDFVPVIQELESQNIKTILYTYYEKKRDSSFSRSNHLIKSVYKYVLLNKEDFENCPLEK